MSNSLNTTCICLQACHCRAVIVCSKQLLPCSIADVWTLIGRAIDCPRPRQMDILLLSPRKLRLLKNPKTDTGEDDFVLCAERCLRSPPSIFALSVWPNPIGKSLHAIRFVGFNRPKNLVPFIKKTLVSVTICHSRKLDKSCFYFIFLYIFTPSFDLLPSPNQLGPEAFQENLYF